MKRSLKLTLLSVFLLLVVSNSTNAAFPKEKQVTESVVTANSSAPSSELVEKKMTKAEAKNELKSLKNEKPPYRGGGKSKIVAALLAFFLGGFGVHSFYMGQKKKGFIQLGLTVVGIVLLVAGLASFISGTGEALPILAIIGYVLLLGVGIWAFVDFIRILTGSLAPEEGFDD